LLLLLHRIAFKDYFLRYNYVFILTVLSFSAFRANKLSYAYYVNMLLCHACFFRVLLLACVLLFVNIVPLLYRFAANEVVETCSDRPLREIRSLTQNSEREQ